MRLLLSAFTTCLLISFLPAETNAQEDVAPLMHRDLILKMELARKFRIARLSNRVDKRQAIDKKQLFFDMQTINSKQSLELENFFQLPASKPWLSVFPPMWKREGEIELGRLAPLECRLVIRQAATALAVALALE